MSVISFDPDDEEVRWIFRSMLWTTQPIGHTLRGSGRDIPRKIEYEQAAAMIWMLRKYQEHGKDWRLRGDEELRRMGNSALPDSDPMKITARAGLLWRKGEQIALPEADILARQYGFRCAEQFVRALEKEQTSHAEDIGHA